MLRQVASAFVFYSDSLARCWLFASAVAEGLVTGPAMKEKVVKCGSFCAALAPSRRPCLTDFCCTMFCEVEHMAVRTSDALHTEDIFALFHLASDESMLIVRDNSLSAHVALTVTMTLVAHKRNHMQYVSI